METNGNTTNCTDIGLLVCAGFIGLIMGSGITGAIWDYRSPDPDDIRREIRRDVLEEYRARFKTWERDHLADAVEVGYGEWYIGPTGQNEFRWKPKPKAPEQGVRSHAEAVEIIRNRRSGQWLALPNGAIINLETGDKE